MTTSITVDEFYLYAFLVSGVKSGLLKRTDFSDELRLRTPRFRGQVRRIHELLLLCDKIVLTCDYAVTRGSYAIAEYPLPLPLAVAARLAPLGDSRILIPDIDSASDRLEYFMAEIDNYMKVLESCEKSLGLQIEVMDGWMSMDAIADAVRKDIEKMGKRDLGGCFERYFSSALDHWPLVGKYLRRKFPEVNHLQLDLFRVVLQMYLYMDTTALMDGLRKAPFYKNDRQILEAFYLLVSYVLYSAQVVSHFLETSERTAGASALCVRAPRLARSNQTLREATVLLRTTFHSLEDAGLICPQVRHLEDAIRLRNNPRVRDFRAALWEWAEAVRAGRVGAAQKVQSEVKKANKALKALGKYQRMSRWITWVGLPAGVAGLFGGSGALAITGAALAVGAVGTDLAAQGLERKSGWLLFLQGK